MKIVLFNPTSNKPGFINKDISGGYGTVSNFGTAFIPKLLTAFKKRSIQYPPLVFAYLAAIFKRDGHTVKVIHDISGITNEDDLAILYGSIVDFRYEISQAQLIKGRYPCIKVGFIGSFCSVKPDLFMDIADFVITGEPESAVIQISRTGKIPSEQVNSELIENLDELPFPDWSIFDFNEFKYKPYFINQSNKRFFPVLSSRGCPYSCSYYCPYTVISHNQYRKRSAQNVIAEIEELVQKYDARLILFRDPNFTIDMERVRKISEGIIAKKLNIRFVCETHSKNLTPDLIDLMYEAGLRAVKLGIEAASAGTLNDVKRHNDSIKHQEELIGYCEEKRIGVTAFYIIGLPEDSRKSVMETIKYAKKLNTSGAQFTIATPYPGTKFYEDLERQDLLITKDYERYDIQTPVFHHKNLNTHELLKLKNYAYQTYYLRPSWVINFVKGKLTQ